MSREVIVLLGAALTFAVLPVSTSSAFARIE